jgi:hypothetical protein
MKPEQRIKLVGWLGFSIALPLLVYPWSALSSYLRGSGYSLTAALAAGDLLFLVVVTLASTLNE